MPHEPRDTAAQEDSNFRIAGEAELWSLFSRFLTFEEPSDRFNQLRKAVRKQFDKKGSFEALKLSQQAHRLAEICAARPQDALVSFALAFEDLKRFNQLTFASWMRSEWSNAFPNRLFDLEQFEFTGPEILWLNNAIAGPTGWWQVTEDGPWSTDARVRFIASFISQASKRFSPSAFSLTEAPNVLELWRKVLSENRHNLPGSFLPKVVVLVEGQSEALIMPTFAKLTGADFNSLAVHIEPCNGAKQVVKNYLNLKELTVLPILCVLDNDVSEAAEIITDSLRPGDRMIQVSQGEIEDSFSTPVFHRLINIYLKEIGCLEPIEYDDLARGNGNRIETLDRLFRIRGLGNFDKIGFAQTVAGNLNRSDLPEDGERIIGAIVEIHNAGSKLRFE